MDKKTKAALRLSKQTLRNLTTTQMKSVHGGRRNAGCDVSCTHTQWTEPPFNSEACTDSRL
jgi:hypothetical protein